MDRQHRVPHIGGALQCCPAGMSARPDSIKGKRQGKPIGEYLPLER